eukprot:scaffold275650_cov16-Tisochrysis_lutea.AAC.1
MLMHSDGSDGSEEEGTKGRKSRMRNRNGAASECTWGSLLTSSQTSDLQLPSDDTPPARVLSACTLELLSSPLYLMWWPFRLHLQASQKKSWVRAGSKRAKGQAAKEAKAEARELKRRANEEAKVWQRDGSNDPFEVAAWVEPVGWVRASEGRRALLKTNCSAREGSRQSRAGLVQMGHMTDAVALLWGERHKNHSCMLPQYVTWHTTRAEKAVQTAKHAATRKAAFNARLRPHTLQLLLGRGPCGYSLRVIRHFHLAGSRAQQWGDLVS